MNNIKKSNNDIYHKAINKLKTHHFMKESEIVEMATYNKINPCHIDEILDEIDETQALKNRISPRTRKKLANLLNLLLNYKVDGFPGPNNMLIDLLKDMVVSSFVAVYVDSSEWDAYTVVSNFSIGMQSFCDDAMMRQVPQIKENSGVMISLSTDCD